ncbi:MAG: ABC transporter ATP-binding protein [Steroidobacteraceae bacterium]
MTRPVLRLTGVCRRYHPERPAVLEGIDLELGQGEYVAILGESGVGKSTLLNLVAGLDRPDAGTIEIDGEPLHALDDDAATLLRRRRVGFVFQAFHLLPHLTVLDNVALPLHLLGEPRKSRERAAGDMLEAVGLAGFGSRFPRELSGGEMQRVAIARALVHGPGLLLADEPTGNLDPTTASRVLELLRERIVGQGASGVLITHSRAAAATAQRVMVLDGRSLRPLQIP